MTEKELSNLGLKTKDGIFTPSYTFNSYDADTKTYVGLVITKTAEEVYQERLEDNKAPTDEPVPDEDVAMAEAIIELHAEIEILKNEIQTLKGEKL